MNSGLGVNASRKPRKYNRFIDVVAYDCNGTERPLTKEEVRQLLGIKTRKTLNEYLRDLGLPNQRLLNWSQIRNLVGAQLWCKAGEGCNSKRQYALMQATQIEELQGQSFGEYVLQNQHNLSVEQHINALKTQFLSEINHVG